MNLDDLRRELRTRAAEPRPTSMDDRLAGVRHKVVAARRRKAVAGGVAALASLAAVGVAVGQVVGIGGNGNDVADSAGSAFAPLPDQLNGDLLIAAQYNEADQSELQWENVTLESRDVVVTITCQIPDGAEPPRPDQPVRLAWNVGSASVTSPCGAYGSADAHSTVVAVRTDWHHSGVRPDEPFEIDLWLEQGGDLVEVPGARFGIGLYEKTGDRVRRHGVELTEILDIDGERYRLEDYAIQRLGEGRGGRQLRLRTQEVEGRIAVVYGWRSNLPAAPYELLDDGEELRSGYGGSIDGPTVIDGDTPHALRLQAGGSSLDGTLVLAYYVLD